MGAPLAGIAPATSPQPEPAGGALLRRLEGHTDSVGSDEYNLKLSQQRADSVRDYLVAQAVPGSNVTAVGLGKV